MGTFAGEGGAAARIGELFFKDTRFAHSKHIDNPALDRPTQRAMSCLTCHFIADESGHGSSLFGDRVARSTIPERGDGRTVTARNSPPLVGALVDGRQDALLHYDAEFVSVDSLVAETFLGRNFGWRPEERDRAEEHFVRVVRHEDAEARDEAGRRLSYATLLRGTDPAVPGGWRLPGELRFDPAAVSGDEVVMRSARLVGIFLRTLQFSRDASSQHDGSAYDAFLAANLLPRAPRHGESDRQYARRLGELIAGMRVPRFSNDAGRSSRGGTSGFGPTELKGMQIFFREGIAPNQMSGAGSCVECHVPPHFTDLKFHNTGVAQDEYDEVHGPGAFARLAVPSLVERAQEPGRWLPATPAHPRRRGVFFAVPSPESPVATDLGLWNVYANPDFPAPQQALERLLNPDGRRSPEEVLASTVGQFKTSHLRGLGHTAPYFHTGRARSLEETVRFYERMSRLARGGHLRNAPREFFAVRLGEQDIAPLVAFLEALNEDYRPDAVSPEGWSGNNVPDTGEK